MFFVSLKSISTLVPSLEWEALILNNTLSRLQPGEGEDLIPAFLLLLYLSGITLLFDLPGDVQTDSVL